NDYLSCGCMPHMGIEIVDENGLRLIHDWIRQLPRTKEERSLLAKLYDLDESTVAAHEKATAEIEIHREELAIAKTNNRTTPNTEDRKAAEVNFKNHTQVAAKQRRTERDKRIKKLLGTTAKPTLQ